MNGIDFSESGLIDYYQAQDRCLFTLVDKVDSKEGWVVDKINPEVDQEIIEFAKGFNISNYDINEEFLRAFTVLAAFIRATRFYRLMSEVDKDIAGLLARVLARAQEKIEEGDTTIEQQASRVIFDRIKVLNEYKVFSRIFDKRRIAIVQALLNQTKL